MVGAIYKLMNEKIVKLSRTVERIKYIVDDLVRLDFLGKEIINESFSGLITELNNSMQLAQSIKSKTIKKKKSKYY